jgi:superfamily I DNA/RNA helicase
MATEVLLSSADATPQFTHILLDEAQDTSESQLRLLQLLAPRGRTVITAVGDADQSIFAFRGAKASAGRLPLALSAPALAPPWHRPQQHTRSDARTPCLHVGTLGKITSTFGCMPLVLPTNYRCCSRVVEVARALIEASMLREELPLLSARHAAVGEVRSIVCAARQDEIDAICREVYRATRAQDGASSIALLCRLRADCNALRRALKEYGVECSRVSSGFGAAGEGGASGGGGGEGAAAKALLAWLRLVIDPNDDDAFLSAIATPPRTGFAGGETSVGLRYLRALAAEKSSRAKKVSLLVSAVHAARHRWPAIAPTGNDRSPPRLNRPQEEALTSFLHDYDHLRTAALKANGAGMHTLLPIHAVRIGLIDALAKERVSRASKRATFHVAGGPGASITSASSDEEDEGSADAGQQHRRAARRELERLLDTAAIVSQSVGSTRNHASGGAQDSLAVLRRFIDELALAAYDDVDYTQGSARTGSHASGSSSLAQSRPARSTPAVVTTIHQSKGALSVFRPPMHCLAPPLCIVCGCCHHSPVEGALPAFRPPFLFVPSFYYSWTSPSPGLVPTPPFVSRQMHLAYPCLSTPNCLCIARGALSLLPAFHPSLPVVWSQVWTGAAPICATCRTFTAPPFSLRPSFRKRSHPFFACTAHIPYNVPGLEWDCVYVCHMQDGILPLLPRNLQPNSLEYVDQLEEERRLAYVAFTRARRTLVLTWSEGTAVPEERLVRSRFLSKLPLNVVPPGTPTTQRVR